MDKIKVAFFADTLLENIDGAVRTMYQIINRIPSDRFEFLFIVGQKPEEDLKFKCIEVPTVTIPFNDTYKMAVSTFVKSKLNSDLNKFSPDVIHIATPSILGSFALSYAESNNLLSLSIYHTHFLSYLSYYFRRLPFLIRPSQKLLIAHMQSFYNKCDVIYVPSNSMVEELSAIGVLSNKMILWRRGLDNEMFNPSKRDPDFLPQEANRPVFNILFASRLVWEKNLATLGSIYKKSEELQLPYRFIIAGDGYAKEELEVAMPKAVFMGELSQLELSNVYASSDVFLFPSISETYGNVVVEAMASGLPCIIAKGGGTNDYIHHMESGIICSPNNECEYIDAIELLRRNTALKTKLINNALEYSRGLSWDSLVSKYFSDLEAMVDYQVNQIA